MLTGSCADFNKLKMQLKTVCHFCYQLLLVIALLPMLSGKTQNEETTPFTLTTSCEEHAECLPWTECSHNKCVCREELSKYYSIKCNNNTLQLSVIKCHCVTFDNETKELIEGNCIENCENHYEKDQYLPLPSDANKLNQFMCEERWNRTGRLCGKCLPGHSPLAYSYDMRCVKCPEGNRNVWKYILVAFGPLTVFYFLVLFLKINATSSSHLRGYLIFSQIIATPVSARIVFIYQQNHPQSKIPIQTLTVMYGIWNLDFFRGFYSDICLDVSSLTILALDYAVAIYPLLLTVLSYFLIELHARNVRIVVILWKPFRCLFILLRRNWDSRTTIIDAYATFFILAFVKILTVSTDLLIPVRAHTLTNDSVTWVLYYDATVDYFGREHLPYAILAIVCLMMIIFPTIFLLLIYQFRCFQRLLSCLKIRSQLLPALMDSFQGCYKNGTDKGTRDYRWFAAVPLIGRFVLLLAFSVTLDSSYVPFIILIIISIIVFIVLVQPYKTHLSKYATLDVTFWGFLAAFFASVESSTYNNLKPPLQRKFADVSQVTVGVLPLLYMTCISAYWILSRMRKLKLFVSQMNARRRGYLNMENNFEEEALPDRLVNPENYQYQERNLQDLTNDATNAYHDTY